MIGKEIKNEEPVTLSEARETLEQRKEDLEEDEELRYEQKITLQYLQRFGEADPERAKEALEELQDMGINKKLAGILVNLMPEHEEQIDLVYEKERFEVDEEEKKKILKIIDDLREAE